VLPAAGEVRYLKANPGADARNAAARLKAGAGAGSTEGVPPAQSEPGETAQEPTQTAAPQATTTPQPSVTPQTTTPQTPTPAPVTTPQAPVAAVPPATTQTGQ
jgi:hypothetical protein